MLSHHLYSEPFPQMSDNINEEFNTLVQFLYLGSKTDLFNNNSITHCLNWSCDTPLQLVQTWCQEYINFVSKSLISSRVMPFPINFRSFYSLFFAFLQKLLKDPPLVWRRPSLLRLPKVYDQLFMFYHQRQCRVCSKIPKDPSICLICGTLVCMRESCCRSESCLEAVFVRLLKRNLRLF